jgi:hypothetical protein
MTVVAEREEGLLWSVARRRQAIRPKADPGQEGHQDDMPSRLLAEGIERRA